LYSFDVSQSDSEKDNGELFLTNQTVDAADTIFALLAG